MQGVEGMAVVDRSTLSAAVQYALKTAAENAADTVPAIEAVAQLTVGHLE